MCMKYVNAIVSPYGSISVTEGHLASLNAPLASIPCQDKEGTLCIGGFYVVTGLTFLGTSNKEHEGQNPIAQGDTIDITIRLTMCDEEFQERPYIDLDSFSVNLEDAREKGLIQKGDIEFYEYTRITTVNQNIALPKNAKPGRYVLKVIVKSNKLGIGPSIQTLTSLDLVLAQ